MNNEIDIQLHIKELSERKSHIHYDSFYRDLIQERNKNYKEIALHSIKTHWFPEEIKEFIQKHPDIIEYFI